jgi:hypothetical protein
MIWPWRDLQMLNQMLADSERATIQNESELRGLRHQLEIERAKRVAAESIAAERLSEIERLRIDLRESGDRERERMKSLDLLNVKLMESRVEPPPPDIKQFALQQIDHLRETVRSQNRAVDIALLQKFHPKFESGKIDESSGG